MNKKAEEMSPVIAVALLLVIAVIVVIGFSEFTKDDYDTENDYPKDIEFEELDKIPLELYDYVVNGGYECFIQQETNYKKYEICCEKFDSPIIEFDYYNDNFYLIMDKEVCE